MPPSLWSSHLTTLPPPLTPSPPSPPSLPPSPSTPQVWMNERMMRVGADGTAQFIAAFPDGDGGGRPAVAGVAL
jgi:hypothetical protein